MSMGSILGFLIINIGMEMTVLGQSRRAAPMSFPTDPKHLADGVHILFIDKNNGACSDNRDRVSVVNPETPWCGLAAIEEGGGRKFRPGDTIYIKGGEYSMAPLRLFSAGTINRPIKLRSYPGESVTLCGNGASAPALITFFSGADHWLVSNLTIRATAQKKLIDGYHVSGLTLKDCEFGPIPAYGSAVIGLQDCSDVTLDHVKVFGVADITLAAARVTSCDGVTLDQCRRCVIRQCKVGDCGHVGINLRNSADNVIEMNVIENRLHTGAAIINIPGNPGASVGNVFRRNIVRGFNQMTKASEPSGIGLEILYASSNLVCNNLFLNGANDATGLSIVADPTKGEANENRVIHNTFWRTGARGIEIAHFGRIGTKNSIRGNRIYNNIIEVEGGADSRSAPIAMTFHQFEENAGYGNEFKNNLLHGGDAFVVKSRTANAALRRAYTAEALNTTNFAQGNIDGDPRFVQAGSDFHLRQESPAVGAGILIEDSDGDFEGRKRTGRCDLGAYQSEFKQSPGIGKPGS